MEITEITVSYSRRVQLDRFEPVEYQESITATVDSSDDPSEVSDELRSMVRDHVERGVLSRVMAHKMEDAENESE